MALVGQNQQTTFANPQNGQAPDADVIRGNDNALVSKHNAHDADATIHVQTGTLAARPAAGTAGAVYIDENKRIYVDNGSAWGEVPYARLDAAGTNAFDNNVSIGGTLTVTTGLTDVMDLDAADIVADTVTAGSFTGAATGLTGIPSANLTGALPAVSGANLTNLTAGNLTGTLPAISGANLTSLNASNISTGTLASARLPGTIAANTTGSAQSLVNGSNSIAIAGSTVITIAAGSGSGVTGVNYTVGAFQQGPNGYPNFSSAAAFIPVSIAGTDYFIRCERWTP